MHLPFRTSLVLHTISGRGVDMRKQIPGWKKILNRVNEEPYNPSPVPLIEILSDKRVLIEQHRGVIQYGNAEIGIRVKFGIILVTGKNLCLSRMSKEQLVICGSIDGVRLIKTGEGRSHD